MRKLTEMNRRRFFEIMNSIIDGSMTERWPEGKIPETRAEKVEARQVGLIGMIYDGKDDSKELREILKSESWAKLEISLDEENNMIRIRVLDHPRR